ncbi:MAG: hypothetical protein ACOCWY_06770 [Thermodesulfobacteriota bacterium]
MVPLPFSGEKKQALEEKISILPGGVCSLSGRFRNYIRIGCGHPFTEATDQGIQKLGRIIADLAAGSGPAGSQCLSDL